MKPMRSLLLAIPALALGACQPTLTAHSDAGTPGAAGSSGSGGTEQTAGAAGTGQSSGTSGTQGSAGDGSLGGATGTAGSAAGAGGSAAGSAGASGGSAGGGASGAAGTSSDAGATGGAAGGGAGTSGETVMDLFGIKNDFNESLVDSFFLWPCYTNQNQDCITNLAGTTCPTPKPNGTGLDYEEQGLVVNETFKVGGTSGKMYNATIQVNGISEAKYYEHGTRAAGNTDPPNAQSDLGTNTWYVGGNPIYFEYYNVYSIRVYDTAGKELQHYYLNSFPKTGNVQYEDHWTFAISYKATFPVMGGGTIVYHASDINCHAIDNCGSATTSQTCPLNQARVVPNEPGLKVPAMYQGKPTSGMNYRTGATQPWHSHIIHIRFTDVAPM
jgi:hypothetical protein